MKNKEVGNIIVCFLVAVFIFNTKADACGGLLVSDAGEFDLPLNYNGERFLQCVWVIQLLSRRTVSFTLNRLDGTSPTVSLYPEHEASETVLNPIRLSRSDVGLTTETTGQTLIVILTSSDNSAGVSFTWDSRSIATSDVLTAANYVDSGEGRVYWNRFSRRERLTSVLNMPSQNSITLKVETEFSRCDLVNPCQCSYFGIYEVTKTGFLQEVARVCGRSTTFETEQLYPKLVAFVHLNSTVLVAETNHVELGWSPQNSVTEDPGHSSEGTTKSSPTPCFPVEYPGYEVITIECDGLINIPNLPYDSSYLVEYSTTAIEKPHCLWTLNNTKYTTEVELNVRVTLLCEENTDSNTTLSVISWKFINNDWDLASTELSQNSPVYSTNTSGEDWDVKLFLSYTPPKYAESRFLVLIEILSTLPVYPASCFHYDTVEGIQMFPPFKSSHRFSMVLNPFQDETKFTVDYLDSKSPECGPEDTMDVFEIAPKIKPRRLGRLCGDISIPRTYVSKFPFLITFQTYYSLTGRGFQFSWE